MTLNDLLDDLGLEFESDSKLLLRELKVYIRDRELKILSIKYESENEEIVIEVK